GSYYSPSVVVESLLDTALEPVLDEAMAATDPEAALLALTICDPACGTGRFLVAASHRVAQRLVRVREQRGASPKEVAGAYREVVLRCVYGVDLHPWTVELCRVALWLEVSEPGWSPSTLGRHVRCGNGLLGATPALMAEGVPDRAFIREDGTSDEKATALQVRRRNRAERRQASGPVPVGADAADAWCAAFVWPMVPGTEEEVLTDAVWRAEALSPKQREQVKALSQTHRFVHWHMAFPQVFGGPSVATAQEGEPGWSGGFDVVLGNPPFVNAIEGAIGPATRALSRYAHPLLSGTADLAFYFVSLALTIVRPGGRVGLVQPRAILNASSAQALRAARPRGLGPVAIAVPERANLFPGAAVFVCLLTLGPGARCKVTRADDFGHWVECAWVGANWWRWVVELTTGRSLTRPEGWVPLSERFRVSASMTTGDAYAIKPWVRDGADEEGLKLVTTGLVEPGQCMWGQWRCRYLKDDYQHPWVPLVVEGYPPALRRRLERARRPKIIV
ncbi:MAG: DNA methyltransferase, partial [Myxococcota bacterium]